MRLARAGYCSSRRGANSTVSGSRPPSSGFLLRTPPPGPSLGGPDDSVQDAAAQVVVGPVPVGFASAHAGVGRRTRGLENMLDELGIAERIFGLGLPSPQRCRQPPLLFGQTGIPGEIVELVRISREII